MQALNDIDLLSRLVSFDTTSATGQPTRPLGDFVCDYLDLPGVRIERFDCGGGQENIHVAVGPECVDGEGLMLCGHVDCVPAEEPEWTGDPFTLRCEDDRLIGRGACDMKGFDALAINVLRRRAVANDLKEPLVLLLTCNEEIGTVGAGRFVQQWGDRPIPRRTVVGEPTSLRPIRAHKGHLGMNFAVGGRGGHTGFPESGVNAIELSIPLLQGIRSLREELAGEQTEWSDLFPSAPAPVLTVATINGGSAINIIPESCVLRVGLRLLPGQSSSDFIPRLLDAVPGVKLADGDRLDEVPEGEIWVAILNDTPSFGIEADSPFLAEINALVEGTQQIGANYGTDAGRIARLGCTSVVFGPGDIMVAHKPDEWIPRAEFERTPALLETLIR